MRLPTISTRKRYSLPHRKRKFSTTKSTDRSFMISGIRKESLYLESYNKTTPDQVETREIDIESIERKKEMVRKLTQKKMKDKMEISQLIRNKKLKKYFADKYKLSFDTNSNYLYFSVSNTLKEFTKTRVLQTRLEKRRSRQKISKCLLDINDLNYRNMILKPNFFKKLKRKKRSKTDKSGNAFSSKNDLNLRLWSMRHRMEKKFELLFLKQFEVDNINPREKILYTSIYEKDRKHSEKSKVVKSSKLYLE